MHHPLEFSIGVKDQDFIVGTCNLSVESLYKEVQINHERGNMFSYIPSKEVYAKTFLSIDDNVCGKPFSQHSTMLDSYEVDSNNNIIDENIPDANSYSLSMNDIIENDQRLTFSIEIKIDDLLVGDCNISLENFHNNVEISDGSRNVFSFSPIKEVFDNVLYSINDNGCGKAFSHGPKTLDPVLLDTNNNLDYILDERDSFDDFKENRYVSKYASTHFPSFETDVHGNSIKDHKLECMVCGEMFARIMHYENHMKTKHVGVNPYHCKFCGKSFKRKNDLQRHTTNCEKGRERIDCYVCAEHFTRASHYEYHMIKSHADVKAYYCEFCRDGFGRKRTFQEHSAHCEKGNQRYECKVCGEYFKRAFHYEKHMKINHVDVKAYHCEICGKGFGSKFELKQHKKGTGSKKCVVCGKKFKSICCLTKHMVLNH